MGANEAVVSRNADEMKTHAFSFDFILDTVSAQHDIDQYIQLLGIGGNLTLVGGVTKPQSLSSFGLIFGKGLGRSQSPSRRWLSKPRHRHPVTGFFM